MFEPNPEKRADPHRENLAASAKVLWISKDDPPCESIGARIGMIIGTLHEGPLRVELDDSETAEPVVRVAVWPRGLMICGFKADAGIFGCVRNHERASIEESEAPYYLVPPPESREVAPPPFPSQDDETFR